MLIRELKRFELVIGSAARDTGAGNVSKMNLKSTPMWRRTHGDNYVDEAYLQDLKIVRPEPTEGEADLLL